MDPISPPSSAQASRSDKIVWTSYLEHIFIEFMHEEFISNRLQSSTFSPSVWTRICERMNAAVFPSHVFTTDQLKGKLNRLRRAWRCMNDILNRGTGWGWDSKRNIITDDAGRLDELYRGNGDDDQLTAGSSGGCRSRDDYEDTVIHSHRTSDHRHLYVLRAVGQQASVKARCEYAAVEEV
ncbi:hypothetical protein Salat_1744400 [Sesamum alatum]|uniref:Myb/SANT-like domain-containing protein n=1 Tax=Sesamum alatum TaxID=300844 RepID=A0AAE1Y8V7_9LAMI|nr:hypothetical protein Salat_1744400 [Sesamum alatum]